MSKAPQAIVHKPLLMARPDAAAYLSLSESMLDKLVAAGDMPPPRKLSGGRSAWLVPELDAWGTSRPVSDLLSPKDSGYGRAGKPAATPPPQSLRAAPTAS